MTTGTSTELVAMIAEKKQADRSVMAETHEDHDNGRQRAPAAGLTHCTACGASGYPDDRYCSCCGNIMAHICPACGETVQQPIAFYCTHCGAALSGDTSQRLT